MMLVLIMITTVFNMIFEDKTNTAQLLLLIAVQMTFIFRFRLIVRISVKKVESFKRVIHMAIIHLPLPLLPGKERHTCPYSFTLLPKMEALLLLYMQDTVHLSLSLITVS